MIRRARNSSFSRTYPLWAIRPSRDNDRREQKAICRRNRVQAEVLRLLTSCPIGIVEEQGILSEEELNDITTIYYNIQYGTGYDYYPIPKVIHNKIRRYVHSHRLVMDVSLEIYIFNRQLQRRRSDSDYILDIIREYLDNTTTASTINPILTTTYL